VSTPSWFPTTSSVPHEPTVSADGRSSPSEPLHCSQRSTRSSPCISSAQPSHDSVYVPSGRPGGAGGGAGGGSHASTPSRFPMTCAHVGLIKSAKAIRNGASRRCGDKTGGPLREGTSPRGWTTRQACPCRSCSACSAAPGATAGATAGEADSWRVLRSSGLPSVADATNAHTRRRARPPITAGTCRRIRAWCDRCKHARERQSRRALTR
jgi:hypothetical protein